MARRGVERLLREVRSACLLVAALHVLVEEGPVHGYGLRRRLAEILGWEPPESTVYDVLKRLEKAGIAKSYWARSGGAVRKYYEAHGGAEEVLQALMREVLTVAAKLAPGLEEPGGRGVREQ